jgi:uridine phosphorylase
VANRILTVGDKKRALNIAAHLTDPSEVIESSRGFVTISGTFEGIPVSIVAIGMVRHGEGGCYRLLLFMLRAE